jgi:hypothetical protein
MSSAKVIRTRSDLTRILSSTTSHSSDNNLRKRGRSYKLGALTYEPENIPWSSLILLLPVAIILGGGRKRTFHATMERFFRQGARMIVNNETLIRTKGFSESIGLLKQAWDK